MATPPMVVAFKKSRRVGDMATDYAISLPPDAVSHIASRERHRARHDASQRDSQQTRDVSHVQRRAQDQRHRLEVMERREPTDAARWLPDPANVVQQVGAERERAG